MTYCPIPLLPQLNTTGHSCAENEVAAKVIPRHFTNNEQITLPDVHFILPMFTAAFLFKTPTSAGNLDPFRPEILFAEESGSALNSCPTQVTHAIKIMCSETRYNRQSS